MKLFVGASICLAALLAGCAFSVPTAPAQFTSAAAEPQSGIVMRKAAEVRFSTGFTRILAEGSRWRLAGHMPQGRVYRPVNASFTIEGRNMHEAWLVIDGARLVGFYLVGENAYSPLDLTVQLQTETYP